MRLFNRRKEIEFDDPRLVGMAPLKPTEAIYSGQSPPPPPQPQRPRSSSSTSSSSGGSSTSNDGRSMATLVEEERPFGRKDGLNLNHLKRIQQLEQPDKCKMINVSTWKRVARPWDSLRRSESSEQLSRSVISNRRKTLHFCPDTTQEEEGESMGDSNNKCEERRGSLIVSPSSLRIPVIERVYHLKSSQQKPQQQQDSVQHSENVPISPKRKIGRVESLRLLLTSKSNKIYRGKFANSTKQDKGTSTQDLNYIHHDNNNLENFHMSGVEQMMNDEVFHSKYSSISSLKSDTLFNPLSTTSQFQSRFSYSSLTKATSCENLSLQNVNQNGRTLPGYRDSSTSTTPFLDSLCCSPQNLTTTTTNNNTKRSSFPYAYIRSRLTSLQEEPKKINKSPVKPPRISIIAQKQALVDQKQQQKQQQKSSCSLASNFMHKGFYHSMGNLLTETKEHADKSQKDNDHHHSSAVDATDGEDVAVDVESSRVSRIFDPLKQIRIDLLHGNPSEIDEQQSPSPTSSFWGRRSYSIGDMMLNDKKRVGKSDSANSNGVEESGYDSDSTRNGHESPRNSVKSSEETEGTDSSSNEIINTTTTTTTNTRGQCAIIKTNERKQITIKGTKLLLSPSSDPDESLSDSQSQSNESESSAVSSSESSCSFPASGGCLITINPIINRTPTSRAPSVNGFRKGEDGSIIEVTSEIDQSEDVDFYSSSATINGTLESNKSLGLIKPQESTNTLAIVNYHKSSSNQVVVSSSSGTTSTTAVESSLMKVNENSGGGEMIKSVTVVGGETQSNKETFSSTTTIKKETTTNDISQKTSSSAPSLRLRNRVRDKDREWNSIKPSRSKSLCLSIFTVNFNKGPKKKSLGFSIIGGKDSAVAGIFIKRIFPYGQASEDGSITEGDEILSVNGQPLASSTHAEALNIFKSIKTGEIVMEVARREFLSSHTSQTLKRQYSQLTSKSCEQLHKAY